MPSVACPRCATIVQTLPGQSPVCPKCGFGAPAAPSVAASPPAYPPMAQPGYAPPGAWATGPGGFVPPQLSKKAKQAKTWGILGVVLPLGLVIPLLGLLALPAGIACAITAIVMGATAKRELAPYGTVPEASAARTAVVLGIVGLCAVPLVIVFAAVVFVLVTKLSASSAAIILA